MCVQIVRNKDDDDDNDYITNELCCCLVNIFSLYFVRQNILYSDILGGCIPAVLIVTIFPPPYKHDQIYFILVIIFSLLFLIMFLK